MHVQGESEDVLELVFRVRKDKRDSPMPPFHHVSTSSSNALPTGQLRALLAESRTMGPLLDQNQLKPGFPAIHHNIPEPQKSTSTSICFIGDHIGTERSALRDQVQAIKLVSEQHTCIYPI